MSDQLFSSALMSRCLMPPWEAAEFKIHAERHVFIDRGNGAKVICYQHHDGRILVDEIILPKKAKS